MPYMDDVIRLIGEGKSIEDVGEAVGKSPRTLGDRLRKVGYGRIKGAWVFTGQVEDYPEGEPMPKQVDSSFTAEEVATLKAIASRPVADVQLAEWLLTLRKLDGDKRQVSYKLPVELDEDLTATSERLNLQKTEVVTLALLEFIERY